MAEICKRKPDLLLKLSVTSMGLSLATAKLIAYQREVVVECIKDINYAKILAESYISTLDLDNYYAEKFASISAEVDKLAMEMIHDDE